MDTKVRLRVNTDIIRKLMKEYRLGYTDIEEMSGGSISVYQLKHFMNKGKRASEDTILELSGIFDCDPSLLIDECDLVSLNIPGEINFLIRNLYSRLRENIQPVYAQEIKKIQTKNDLRRMLEIAHRLFQTFSNEDIYTDRSLIRNAVDVVIEESQKDNCLANSAFTELTAKEVDALYERLSIERESYHPNQLFLLFTYAFILFDAIFLVESISTSAQLMPIRKNHKADQYFELTSVSQNMRDTLLDVAAFKGWRFEGAKDGVPIGDTGLDDEVVTGIILLLTACERCYKHLESDWRESEYVNRASLRAMLSRLEKVFSRIGIELPEITGRDMICSRFGKGFMLLRSWFDALNPPAKRVNKTSDETLVWFALGRLSGNAASNQ